MEARLAAQRKSCCYARTGCRRTETVPNIKRSVLDASVSGLNSLTWRSPTHYASDVDNVDDAVGRELWCPLCAALLPFMSRGGNGKESP